MVNAQYIKEWTEGEYALQKEYKGEDYEKEFSCKSKEYSRKHH